MLLLLWIHIDSLASQTTTFCRVGCKIESSVETFAGDKPFFFFFMEDDCGATATGVVVTILFRVSCPGGRALMVEQNPTFNRVLENFPDPHVNNAPKICIMSNAQKTKLNVPCFQGSVRKTSTLGAVSNGRHTKPS
jgi:hypothetical protein